MLTRNTFSQKSREANRSAVKINSKKPKGKNTIKEKKKETGSSHAGIWICTPTSPSEKKVRLLNTGLCDHWTNLNVKLIVLKYFSLPFTLFEPCGAVFMMNSKIHLRKNSSNEYFKAILHYFLVLFTLGLYNGRSMNTLIFFFVALRSSGGRSFGVISSTARIDFALLCLQPAAICLTNTLLFARRFANVQ